MKLKNILKIISISIVAILIISISSINYAAGNCAFSAGGIFSDGLNTKQDALNAKNYYSNMGYSSYYSTSPTFDILNGYFQNGTRRLESDIVFLSGHGGIAGCEMYVNGSTGVIIGTTTSSYVGTYNVNWSNVQLITYAGCKTAYNPEPDYTSIAVDTFRRGAATVVGWRDDINSGAHTKWLNRYNSKLAAGGSIGAAINYANSYNDYGTSPTQQNVKDLGFYGNWNRTFKKSRSIDNLENPNTMIVDDLIEFSSGNENIDGIVSLIETINSDFDLKNYEMKVYKLTDDADYYTIDFTRIVDGFMTDLGYNIIVEDGKVASITNNDKELVQTMGINSKLDEKEEKQYNNIAVSQLKQKAINGELGTTFDENLRVIEQLTNYYLDVNTGKVYYIVSTTYANERNEIDVDLYQVEI